MTIHPTTVISPDAELHPSVIVGPFCLIEAGVKIGAGSIVSSHVRIAGITVLGENNVIDSFVSLGGAPQDIGYKEEATELIIGNNNLIREYASIHRGTIKGGGKTVLGNDNMIMAYSHIGHDCMIGDHVIVVNAAQISGHAEVGDYATVGGLSGIHQFSRIGRLAFIGGGAAVSKDVPPFAMVTGERGLMRISGLNKVGLRRNGMSRDTISKIEAAFRILFYSPELLHNEALEKVERDLSGCEAVDELLSFIRNSKRGVVKRTKKS